MFKKKCFFAVVYSLLLTAFTVYILLDTFVIEQRYAAVAYGDYYYSLYSGEAYSGSNGLADTENSRVPFRNNRRHGRRGKTDYYDIGPEIDNSHALDVNTYSDDDISVTVIKHREYETDIYVADVSISSMKYLKTALAKDTYGRNIVERTSEIAKNNKAVLAINGDYYGARNTGYVVRNGVLYSDSGMDGKEALAINADGSFEIVNEGEVSASSLVDGGAVHVLTFGPSVIKNGEISVGTGDEVGNAMISNPRTAIGIIDKLHYAFVVSDGRTPQSRGLTLHQLAEFMKGLGVSTAYNLDGGGSSTMYFNGNVVNRPTSNGAYIRERSVSDIVYIGK